MIKNNIYHINKMQNYYNNSFEDKAIFVKHIGKGGQGTVDKYKLKNGNFVAVKKIIPNDFDQDDITDTTLHELHALKVLRGFEGIKQLLNN